MRCCRCWKRRSNRNGHGKLHFKIQMTSLLRYRVLYILVSDSQLDLADLVQLEESQATATQYPLCDIKLATTVNDYQYPGRLLSLAEL